MINERVPEEKKRKDDSWDFLRDAPPPLHSELRWFEVWMMDFILKNSDQNDRNRPEIRIGALSVRFSITTLIFWMRPFFCHFHKNKPNGAWKKTYSPRVCPYLPSQ